MARSSIGASPTAQESARTQSRRWTSQLIGIVVLLMVAGTLFPALSRGLNRVNYTISNPSPDDGLEGTLVFEASLIRQGEALYRPIVAEEFVSAPYTPGYTVALAFTRFNPDLPFQAGRMIALLAMLLVGGSIAVFVSLHTRLWWLGLIVGLYWLAFPPAQLWGTRVKPDALALAWTATGLLIASLQNGRWAHWAAVPFALAFLTKQTAFLAPFSVGLSLLVIDRRCAVRFGLIYILAVGAPYLALDLASDGWASAHIWGLHQRSWWNFELFWKYVGLLWWSLPLAGLALLALPEARQQHAYRLALLFMAVAPAAMYGAGEIGAHHNHLLEPMLALSLAGGIGAGLAVRRWTSAWSTRMIAGLALVLLVIQALSLRTTPAWYGPPDGGEFFPPSLERYVAYLQSKPGPVLADNVALVVRAGKDLPFDDPSTMGPAIRSGLWDPRALHAAIEKQHFAAILLEVDLTAEETDATGRWTDETLRVIKAHYRLEFRDTLYAYVPNK